MSDTRPRLRVGVLFGGRSGEHEISLQSAKAVMDNLTAAGFEVVPVGITRQGRWLAFGDPWRTLSTGERDESQMATMLPQPGHPALIPLDDGEDAPTIRSSGAPGKLDVVFPVLHGTYGEDGTVQGLMELAGVPYVGSGVLGSALGMDKAMQKTLWRGLGLPVVDWITTTRRTIERRSNEVVERVEQGLGYPCFTKPCNLGSSVGICKARSRSELLDGLREAATFDADVLIERGVDARELECSVLGLDEPESSVVGEIVPNEDFYSYAAKYQGAGSQAVIPAEVAPEISNQVRTLAVQAFRAVKAEGLARVDFFLERGTNRLYVNEINTMPGFTSISMYPKLWEATGLSFPDLVRRLVEIAIDRHAERSRSKTSYSAEPA